MAILFSTIVIYVFLCGNFWFTESGLWHFLSMTNSRFTEIMHIDRNIFAYSRIYVIEGNMRKVYCLDTSLFGSHVITSCTQNYSQ